MVNLIIYIIIFFFSVDIIINFEDSLYQEYKKEISYRIDLPIKSSSNIKGQNSLLDNKSSDNSSFYKNKNNTEIKTITTETSCSHDKQNTSIAKNYIKFYLTLVPNTFEKTKLLTIKLIDYSEIFTENQLKDITKSIFNQFDEIILNEIPLTTNTESVIIDANINVVYDFWSNWRFEEMNDGLMTNIKMNGSPLTVGTKINYLYLMKFPVYAIVKEVNRFIQEGEEDGDYEWNYKHEVFFENGKSEMFNSIFVSCENGTKTFFEVENNIDIKASIGNMEEISKRKLFALISIKNYIEKNKQFLIEKYHKNNNFAN